MGIIRDKIFNFKFKTLNLNIKIWKILPPII